MGTTNSSVKWVFETFTDYSLSPLVRRGVDAPAGWDKPPPPVRGSCDAFTAALRSACESVGYAFNRTAWREDGYSVVVYMPGLSGDDVARVRASLQLAVPTCAALTIRNETPPGADGRPFFAGSVPALSPAAGTYSNVPYVALPAKRAPDAVPLAELARALRLSPTATREQCTARIQALFVEPERLAAATVKIQTEAMRRERDASARAERAINDLREAQDTLNEARATIGDQAFMLRRLERERGRKR